MTSSHLVSVIVPAFNAETHIADTLDSALAQTHQELEVIVVDDGSSDSTPEIVAAYQARDARVRLIVQRNAGVAAARNRAISEARGGLIAPLDADDLWRPDKLEAQISAMDTSGGSAGMVYAWFVRIDQTGRMLGPFDFRPTFSGSILSLAALQGFAHASNPLLRTELVRSFGGYDESLRSRGGQGSEDWKLNCEMAGRAPVAVAPRYLVGYRQVTGSMSRDPKKALASHLAAVSDVTEEHPEIPSSALRWSETIHALWIAANHARAGSYRTAASLGWWAARRQAQADAAFVFREPFRRYVDFRLRRGLGRLRSTPADALTGQPFATTDLSAADAAAPYPGEAARYRFMAVTAGIV